MKGQNSNTTPTITSSNKQNTPDSVYNGGVDQYGRPVALGGRPDEGGTYAYLQQVDPEAAKRYAAAVGQGVDPRIAAQQVGHPFGSQQLNAQGLAKNPYAAPAKPSSGVSPSLGDSNVPGGTTDATKGMTDYSYGDAWKMGVGDNVAARQQQQQFIDALRAQAEGRGGPSPAELQMRQALDRNVAAMRSNVASMRGVNPLLANRLAMRQGAQMGQEAAGQTSLLRAQEQLAARNQLGSAISGMRGQDQSLAQTGGSLANSKYGVDVQRELGLGNLANDTARLGLARDAQSWGQTKDVVNTILGGASAAAGIISKLFPGSSGNDGFDPNKPTGSTGYDDSWNKYGGGSGGPNWEGSGTSQGTEEIVSGTSGGTNEGGFAFGGRVGYAAGGDVEVPWYMQVQDTASGGTQAQPQSADPQSDLRDFNDRLHDRKLELDAFLKDKNEELARRQAEWNAEQAGDSGGMSGAFGTVGTILSVIPTPVTQAAGGMFKAGSSLAKSEGGLITPQDSGYVPGRAPASGDSPRNDTVPAVLSPGEIVIPRSIAQSPDAPNRAAKFIEALQHQGRGDTEYGHVLESKRKLQSFCNGGSVRRYADGGSVLDQQAAEDLAWTQRHADQLPNQPVGGVLPYVAERGLQSASSSLSPAQEQLLRALASGALGQDTSEGLSEFEASDKGHQAAGDLRQALGDTGSGAALAAAHAAPTLAGALAPRAKAALANTDAGKLRAIESAAKEHEAMKRLFEIDDPLTIAAKTKLARALVRRPSTPPAKNMAVKEAGPGGLEKALLEVQSAKEAAASAFSKRLPETLDALLNKGGKRTSLTGGSWHDVPSFSPQNAEFHVGYNPKRTPTEQARLIGEIADEIESRLDMARGRTPAAHDASAPGTKVLDRRTPREPTSVTSEIPPETMDDLYKRRIQKLQEAESPGDALKRILDKYGSVRRSGRRGGRSTVSADEIKELGEQAYSRYGRDFDE